MSVLVEETAGLNRWQRYPAYRDSGVDWLGEIPAHWDSKPLKFTVHMVGGGTPSKSEPEYWIGDIPWVSPKDMKSDWINDAEDRISERALQESVTSLINPFSVLIVVRSGILKHSLPVAINTIPVALNQDMKALLPDGKVSATYLAWLLRGISGEILTLCHQLGATVDSIRVDQLSNIVLPVPSHEEQRAIAAFLDRKTGEIDALIAKKRELIARLQEQRSAIISHAVTRGLNPDAPMKDSGIEWLGEIPAHWEVVRVKSLVARIESGYSPDCIDSPAGESEWGVLKAGCVNGGVFNPSENKTLPVEITPRYELEVGVGDVLMSRASGSSDLVGSVGIVRELPKARLLLSDKIFRFKFYQPEDCSEYFVRVMESSIGREQVKLAISGAGGLANNVAKSSVLSMSVTLPPTQEQQAIVELLDSATAGSDALIAKAEETISRLQEYRAALISAAVTGRIDVREEV